MAKRRTVKRPVKKTARKTAKRKTAKRKNQIPLSVLVKRYKALGRLISSRQK